jgi:hypothetical protein
MLDRVKIRSVPLRVGLAACLTAVLAASCTNPTPGGGPSEGNTTAAGSPTASPSPIPELVGRWERTNTCQELVDALTAEGLEDIAPAVVADNGYVAGTPEQLAARHDLCAGATPRKHSHFFTSWGAFGSVDWRGREVDDGTYALLGGDRLLIETSTFHYAIDGDTLTLTPVISKAAKRLALADPLRYGDAGWRVAVAFPGYTWERVPCDEWC